MGGRTIYSGLGEGWRWRDQQIEKERWMKVEKNGAVFLIMLSLLRLRDIAREVYTLIELIKRSLTVHK